MKKGYIKLLVINLVLILLLTMNSIYNFLNMPLYILFFVISFFVIRFLIGFEWKHALYTKKDILIGIVMYSIFFINLTYVSGFFLGFLASAYKLTFLSIAKNAIPVILMIFLSELIRYAIIRKGSKYKSIVVLVIILMFIVDIGLKIKGFDLSNGSKLLEFILTICFTSIAKNIFLTYLSYVNGYKTPIIYRLIMELPAYIFPLFPNLGMYINTILEIVFPSLLAFYTMRRYKKNNNEDKTNQKAVIIKRISLMISAILLFVIVILTTGLFKYYMLVIGSNSMFPEIEKGDVIIVQKIKGEEMETLKIGDILVYNHQDIVIVHRIVEIEEGITEKIFYTKGDNNNANDPYPIYENQVIGKTTFKIDYLGTPTVWISEYINKQ